ncbi:hypothetical protein HU200_055633 [Digitaria exilis]|uniref:Rx N-terminal domain-containing protein n=1 Tax=Digitaria exilis TaxID=1010633 RepID=A0A835AIK7_9POAL|nr:hypothetical protein HU200_055633 [Digitaria exilis]
MADFWKLVGLAPCLTVISWFLSPVITFVANELMKKVSAGLVGGTASKLWELEVNTVPELEQTLRDAEKKSKLIAEEDDTSKSLEGLDKMSKALRSALYESEDILDLVDYHRIEKDVRRAGKRHGNIWLKKMHDAARCLPISWLSRLTVGIILLLLLVCMVTIAVLLRRFMGVIQSLRCRFMGADQADIETAIPEAVSTSVSIADDIMLSTMDCIHWFKFRCMDIRPCCRRILSGLTKAIAWIRFFWDWLSNMIVIASSYRDWSYKVVGIDNKEHCHCT